MNSRTGTIQSYNDIYDQNNNKIPFCYEDAKEILKKVANKSDRVVMGRSVYQAISETAAIFMNEVLTKPYASKNGKRPMLPRYFMANIKQKFPEMVLQAEQLYKKYLAQFDQQIPFDEDEEDDWSEGLASSGTDRQKQSDMRSDRQSYSKQPSFIDPLDKCYESDEEEYQDNMSQYIEQEQDESVSFLASQGSQSKVSNKE